jgi:murein DD-endopeptidase MepM/ murein hydrolase activator NlpD
VPVRAGDAVHRGQVLGAIGNSGSSDGPHLHFHVTEAADSAAAPLRGEGVPFVLDSFNVVSHDLRGLTTALEGCLPGTAASVKSLREDRHVVLLGE